MSGPSRLGDWDDAQEAIGDAARKAEVVNSLRLVAARLRLSIGATSVYCWATPRCHVAQGEAESRSTYDSVTTTSALCVSARDFGQSLGYWYRAVDVS